MMTATGVLVGFLPLALNLEEGGDMLQPMAVAAIGGLARSPSSSPCSWCRASMCTPLNRPGTSQRSSPSCTLALVFVMPYLNNRFVAKVTIVFLGSPPLLEPVIYAAFSRVKIGTSR